MSYTQSESEAWLSKLLEDLDSLDTTLISNHYTKDVVVKAANEPEIRGTEALQAHFSGMNAFVLRQQHKILRVDIVRNGLAVYGALEVTFVFKSHPEEPVVLPAMAYMVRVPPGGGEEAGKCSALTIYEDLGGIKEKIMAAH